MFPFIASPLTFSSQAEIKGQTVTWIVPHSFGFAQPASVDMRLMSIFVEFYTTVLGFVNFRLFNSLNLHYPPTLASSTGELSKVFYCHDHNHLLPDTAAEQEDRVMALNQALARTLVEPDAVELDKIEVEEGGEAMEAARVEAEARERQGKLFQGLRFFLGREVPREPLVFMVRAVGGEVSWDATVAPGATYAASDPTITHQVSKRSVIIPFFTTFTLLGLYVTDCIFFRSLTGPALPTKFSGNSMFNLSGSLTRSTGFEFQQLVAFLLISAVHGLMAE